MKSTDRPLSKAKRRILECAENHNLEITDITWTPIGKNLEMCGPEGGWAVTDSTSNVYVGYNVDMVCEDIRFQTTEAHYAGTVSDGLDDDQEDPRVVGYET